MVSTYVIMVENIIRLRSYTAIDHRLRCTFYSTRIDFHEVSFIRQSNARRSLLHNRTGGYSAVDICIHNSEETTDATDVKTIRG